MLKFKCFIVFFITQISLTHTYAEKVKVLHVERSNNLKFESIIKERDTYNDLKGAGGLHSSTYVMTPDGRKRVSELSIDDRIKVFSKSSKTLHFTEIIRIFKLESTTAWDVGAKGNSVIIAGQQGFHDVKETRQLFPPVRTGQTYFTYDSRFKIETLEKKKGRFDFYDIGLEGSYDILLPDHNNLITHRFNQISLSLNDYEKQRRNDMCKDIAITIGCLPCYILAAFAYM